MCVVLAEAEEAGFDVERYTDLPRSFIYHRLDLMPQPNQCSFFNSVVVKGTSWPIFDLPITITNGPNVLYTIVPYSYWSNYVYE